ncbi:MAG: chorismate-binding protein [Candidatus Poseidoniaceae archaeon]|nr:chorismate-binding protein [Candidatus Poseidoniaceae archaeon]
MIDRLLDAKGEDRILLLSGGPKSHLAKRSLFAKGMTKRLVITQPSVSAQKKHSPMNGNTILETNKPPMQGSLQSLSEQGWSVTNLINAKTLDSMLRSLKPHTPNGSVWAGALSYDLVQWTQPLKLQFPPEEGEVLAILWLVEQWDEGEVLIPELENPVRVEGEKSSHSDTEHAQIVQQIKNSITAGELYQLNFGRAWQGPLGEEPAQVFHRLATNNPAPFSGYIEAADLGIALASSSPEILVETEGDEIMTAPIKGTRPRGSDADQETLLRRDLVHDQKERAEHRMLVDLERNDLGIVSKPGSVFQSRFDVEAYANVQHLVSQIKGTLTEDKDGVDALQALFPGGSITGCPKTVVCAAIDELEKRPRSFWTGSMGWIDLHSGNSTWNIMIRTLEARYTTDGWQGTVVAGGGITIESNPDAEVAEAIWKAAALRRACGWLNPDTKPISKGELGIYPLYLEQQPYSSSETFDLNIAFIDNLDSFSYNIIHALQSLGCNVETFDGRGEIVDFNHDAIVIGPGPGRPEISPLSIHAATLDLPTLGICLGHQAIGITRGMRLIESPLGPVHGVPSKIIADGSGLLQSGSHIMTRYNSLILNGEGNVKVTATDETGALPMEIRDGNTYGVQFHPESIGSPNGMAVLVEFLTRASHC